MNAEDNFTAVRVGFMYVHTNMILFYFLQFSTDTCVQGISFPMGTDTWARSQQNESFPSIISRSIKKHELATYHK